MKSSTDEWRSEEVYKLERSVDAADHGASLPTLTEQHCMLDTYKNG